MNQKSEPSDSDYLAVVENLCALNGKLEAIVESSTNGIAEIDREGRLIAWNPSFQKMFEIDRENPDRDFLFDYIPSQGDVSREMLPILYENEMVVLKDILIDNDDPKLQRFLEIKLVPLNIAKHVDFIVIVKDKTEILTALQNRETFIKTLLDLIEDIKIDNRKTIYHLAALVELRDLTTGEHLRRVEAFTRRLAGEYSAVYRSRDSWVTEDYVDDISVSSVLHDIGKVGISDTILLKPDKLSEMEMDMMKQHTSIAGRALEKHRGKKDFLAMGREIALTHHEKWNGKGYPQGLSGTKIPLCGRIVSLCDTYDAITHDRPYKKAVSHERAIEIIATERGESFDPEIVDLFLRVEKDFNRINSELG